MNVMPYSVGLPKSPYFGGTRLNQRSVASHSDWKPLTLMHGKRYGYKSSIIGSPDEYATFIGKLKDSQFKDLFFEADQGASQSYAGTLLQLLRHQYTPLELSLLHRHQFKIVPQRMVFDGSDSCAGLFDPDQKRIYTSEFFKDTETGEIKRVDKPQVILHHEMGHFIDECYDYFSDSPTFSNTVRQDYAKLSASDILEIEEWLALKGRQHRQGIRSALGKAELFATLYQELKMKSDPNNAGFYEVWKFFPKTTALIANQFFQQQQSSPYRKQDSQFTRKSSILI